MKRRAGVVAIAPVLLLPGPDALAGAGPHNPARSTHHPSPPAAPTSGTRKHKCATCARDEHGKIKRDPKARAAFLRQTGCPHGRPGYVVDHIVPLECGGADAPSNMQWQTITEARAKDKTEKNCRR